MAGLVPAISLRKARVLLIGIAGTSPAMTSVYFGGLATATTIEHTSFPRLMISRVSFGSITQESFAFNTVSLPLTMTVNSPRSTK